MNTEYKITDWLPITKEEIDKRGWTVPDIIIVTGDAYIDHPAFGAAVIGRILEANGFRVAILPQPNWRDDLRDFKKLGKPRLFFGVTSGSMDSMVNHYTANKRLRSDDAYTPGNVSGFRPDYATTIYSTILKQLFPETPVIIGGVEASMRRYTHYDYWSDSLRKSILIDSNADLLVYGMGEKSIIEIAKRLDSHISVEKINDVPQTVILVSSVTKNINDVILKSHSDCVKDKKAYAENFVKIETQANSVLENRIIQAVDEKFVVVNAPYKKPNVVELDSYYDLPYTRLPHPKYKKRGVVPAYEMIRHSVNIHRGCFGGCSFCAIVAHQGKHIASRSEKSILNELRKVVDMDDFKGYVSDLGGPSANMYNMQGADASQCDCCKRPSCIFPSVCKNLNFDHSNLIELYRKAENIEGIKKVFIGSGVRYDLLLSDNMELSKKYALKEYTKKLIIDHTSGRLKVAPEHSSENVLKIMRKPSFELFKSFSCEFNKIIKQSNLKYQLIPYFISSHPGCDLADMATLAVDTKNEGFKLEQVQDFTPTPMTLATVMYYTGLNPYTMKPIYVAKSKEQKVEQHRFFFWYKSENREWITKSLKKINRLDLVTKLLHKR